MTYEEAQQAVEDILLIYSIQDRIGKAQGVYECDRGTERADNLKPLLQSCFNDLVSLTGRIDSKGKLC